jgi:hypothetical protein
MAKSGFGGRETLPPSPSQEPGIPIAARKKKQLTPVSLAKIRPINGFSFQKSELSGGFTD